MQGPSTQIIVGKNRYCFLKFFLNNQRGESPFANLYFYIFLSVALHAIAFIFPGGAVDPNKTKRYTGDKLIAISPPTNQTSRSKLDSSTRINKRSDDSKAIADRSPAKQKRTLAPNFDFPYFANELDTQPEIDGHLEIDSAFSNEASTPGRIEILLLISREGLVIWATAEYSDYSPEITTNVISLFKQAKYQPATKDGRSVNAFIRIEANHIREID